MKEYKMLVWNVNTGSMWLFTKKFSSYSEAYQYTVKRTSKMYIVSIIG